MIPTENKNTIHFKQRLLSNCLLHDLEIVTMNGGERTSQDHTLLAVAKFTGKQKKFKSCYFVATPRIFEIFFSPEVFKLIQKEPNRYATQQIKISKRAF
jgi:hypothetical protein